MPIWQDFLIGFGSIVGYLGICLVAYLLGRKFTHYKVPKEIARKSLHMIIVFSIILFVYAFQNWWVSCGTALLFLVLVYPFLAFFERHPRYAKMMVERRPSEVKSSMVVLFSMYAILIAVCWGWLGQRYEILADVFAWGLGDAMAALIGKRFGRVKIEGKMVEGKKSLEGTGSAAIASFVPLVICMFALSNLPWYAILPIAVMGALVCALVELFTKRGMDTITCPFAVAFVLIVGEWVTQWVSLL